MDRSRSEPAQRDPTPETPPDVAYERRVEKEAEAGHEEGDD